MESNTVLERFGFSIKTSLIDQTHNLGDTNISVLDESNNIVVDELNNYKL